MNVTFGCIYARNYCNIIADGCCYMNHKFTMEMKWAINDDINEDDSGDCKDTAECNE